MNRVRKAVFSEAVHKQGILGKGIGIAIVDTGLFPHPDYRSRITGWYDALYQKPAPYDDNGHEATLQGLPPEQEPFLMENTKASHRRQI